MYTLKKLPFSFYELEPFIDTHTIGLHYYKHQASYLTNLNKLLEEDKNDVIFYLGGVTNHDLYWETINPNNKEKPKGKLLDAISKKYGSMDNFWKEFKNLITNLKGSGYVFLIKDKNNNIDLMTTSNQDSPKLYGFTPLLTLDLWEHAYYLNYENDKLKYFDNFKTIVNFNYANKLFN